MLDVKHTGGLRAVSKLVGVATSTLRGWAKSGKIGVFKDAAGEDRFDVREVARFLEENPPSVGRPVASKGPRASRRPR